MSELKTEETVEVLSDMLSAFSVVEIGIGTIFGEKGIEDKSEKLKRVFDILVAEYEYNPGRKAYEIVQITLETAFKNWKVEIEKVVKSYTVS